MKASNILKATIIISLVALVISIVSLVLALR